ncbi:MAG: glycosyltransferase N-terminal domain-containing protein [Pararhodobacter sp.]
MSAPATAPRVLLHATEPDLRPAIRVLAQGLSDRPQAPEVLVSGIDLILPQDGARAIDAFFDANPVGLLVMAGSLLPATLIERAHARGIALMLVGAGTPAAVGRWRLFPGLTRTLLSHFHEIHARDRAAVAAITRILRRAGPIHETGSLARYPAVPACNTFELDALRDALGARPAWCAYGLPLEEAEAALLAHAHALRRAHRLLLILQPSDPDSGAAIAGRARDVGFVCARRSRDEDIDETVQVYIADTDDDPGLFLRLAPVAFLGGSLSPGVATPPAITAASLGAALVFGPEVEADQAGLLSALAATGGGRQIGVAAELGEALNALLAPDVGAQAALKAWMLATEGSEATQTVARAILDWAQLNGGRA